VTKRRECGTKIRHETKESALGQAGQLRRRFAATRSTANVYRCRWCKYWHVGHQPRRRR
jgi:hypothetical protein